MEEERFTEIISIQKIRDNETKKEYDGLVDNQFINLINELANENMMLKGENAHYKLLLMSLEETARRFCEIPRAKK